jgi:hypothetical protein
MFRLKPKKGQELQALTAMLSEAGFSNLKNKSSFPKKG